MEKGRFTLPGETGMEQVIRELIDKWGVDAVRDSDGTKLSAEILEMDLQVYSTLCLIREDNEWAKAHPQYRQQIYLMTEEKVAVEEKLELDIMESFFRDQFAPNEDVDIYRYWQVIDRTEHRTLKQSEWSYEEGKVKFTSAKPFHGYTVSFLAYQLWEPVSMYNHITNGWTEEHRIPLDIRYPEVQEHILRVLQEWLEEHTVTAVVRFTTFFYNFDLIYNQYGKEKQVNWFGYLGCVSPKALEDFEKCYGYSLTPEDFTDAGRYNTLFENPSRKYLDWMDFNQRFVAEYARRCVELVHKAGKKAIMFLGDHWAGTEPYGTYFQSIGLDAVVGAAGDGVTTRMIADIPIAETEARFYPYFFPDIFYDGGNPVKESVPVWIKCRRALMRKPMARMGYGGYLSLANKFPDFMEHVAEISKQFRAIHTEAEGTEAYSPSFKVAVLNSWGRLRTWQTHQIAHSLWNQRCYSYLGVLEALAGLPFEVEFLSFEQIKNEGIPEEVKVIINAGDAGTSWSGADWWLDQDIIVKLRAFVHQGGGLIGVGEPTACSSEGKFFQLSDVLGVQKELGLTASVNKKPLKAEKGHYILSDRKAAMDYGEGMTMIYPCAEQVQVLDIDRSSCGMTAHTYGKGHSVYLAGLPYSEQNSRVLQRAIFWCADREMELYRYYSTNIYVDCHGFPEKKKYCVINNSEQVQETDIYLDEQNYVHKVLQPLEMVWCDELTLKI